MSSPHEIPSQFTTATEQAIERVRGAGIDNASDRDLTLMGFGSVIEELHRLRESFERMNSVNGRMGRLKRQAPTAAGAGGAVAILLTVLQRFL